MGTDVNLASIKTTVEVDDAIAGVYGSRFEARPRLSHITALWEQASGPLRTIRINEHAPKSALDWFVLNASRARADAIITTGQILRDEPSLTYSLSGPNALERVLLRWRRERWGLSEPPWLLILTSGKRVDYTHPAFRGWARPVIFTSDQEASRYLADAPCPVVSDATPDLVRAVQHLRAQRECSSVSIETGPTTSRALYEEPLALDEALVSVFKGRSLPTQAQGEPFVDLSELRARFSTESAQAHQEPSGPWSFYRFTR